MEDLSLLGNAAAVPIIIAITQFLKRNFNFKRKSEVSSLLVSLLVCFGWEFYYTSPEQLILWWANGIIPILKHTIYLLMVSCATWLSASKSYDFFLGEKKTQKVIKEHCEEKEKLKKQVQELQNGKDGQTNGSGAELDEKIRDLLEKG